MINIDHIHKVLCLCWPRYIKTRSHPEMVGQYVVCDLELSPIKNSFCAFLARVKTYTHTKNETCTFTGSDLRAVTGANNAGHHIITTRVIYRQ